MNRSNIFGYHMWTQAWIDDTGRDGGRWVDLDATLDDPPFDATHIALATGAMSDASATNDLIATAAVIGQLRIKVVSTTP